MLNVFREGALQTEEGKVSQAEYAMKKGERKMHEDFAGGRVTEHLD